MQYRREVDRREDQDWVPLRKKMLEIIRIEQQRSGEQGRQIDEAPTRIDPNDWLSKRSTILRAFIGLF